LALTKWAFADTNPATTALVEAFLKKSLLEKLDIHTSLHDEFE
jgi:hypothetical protein